MKKTQRLALVAANQAADATAELLTFAREGALGGVTNFVDDPVAKLADACKLAIEADRAGGGGYDHETDLLHRELCRFLEGWVG